MRSIVLLCLCVIPPLATGQSTPKSTTTHPRRSTASAARSIATSPKLPANIPPAPGKLETAYSLRYIDTKIGDGAVAAPDQFYTVHYTGWLASDGTKFDSSLDRGEPISFLQGAHRVIPGWDTGFAGIHVGGKRRLFIPYQLAYGEQGPPPVIPPKSDLVFDVQLVSVSATPPAADPKAEPAATPPPDHPNDTQDSPPH